MSSDNTELVPAVTPQGSTRALHDYTQRVTSRWNCKPKFMGELALVLQALVDAQNFTAALPAAFCLDTAVGVQLDATGAYVGLSRQIPTPVASLYFGWDDALRGWDRGLWHGPYADATELTALDDDTYRTVLYARALADYWDGTIEQAQAILESLFSDPDTHVIYEEKLESAAPTVFFSWDTPQAGWDEGVWYQAGDASATLTDAKPSIVVGISGKLPPVVLLFALEQNLIPLKPAGAGVQYQFTSINDAPLFGFDVQNDSIAGWDSGTWGVSARYIQDHVPTASAG